MGKSNSSGLNPFLVSDELLSPQSAASARPTFSKSSTTNKKSILKAYSNSQQFDEPPNSNRQTINPTRSSSRSLTNFNDNEQNTRSSTPLLYIQAVPSLSATMTSIDNLNSLSQPKPPSLIERFNITNKSKPIQNEKSLDKVIKRYRAHKYKQSNFVAQKLDDEVLCKMRVSKPDRPAIKPGPPSQIDWHNPEAASSYSRSRLAGIKDSMAPPPGKINSRTSIKNFLTKSSRAQDKQINEPLLPQHRVNINENSLPKTTESPIRRRLTKIFDRLVRSKASRTTLSSPSEINMLIQQSESATTATTETDQQTLSSSDSESLENIEYKTRKEEEESRFYDTIEFEDSPPSPQRSTLTSLPMTEDILNRSFSQNQQIHHFPYPPPPIPSRVNLTTTTTTTTTTKKKTTTDQNEPVFRHNFPYPPRIPSCVAPLDLRAISTERLTQETRNMTGGVLMISHSRAHLVTSETSITEIPTPNEFDVELKGFRKESLRPTNQKLWTSQSQF